MDVYDPVLGDIELALLRVHFEFQPRPRPSLSSRTLSAAAPTAAALRLSWQCASLTNPLAQARGCGVPERNEEGRRTVVEAAPSDGGVPSVTLFFMPRHGTVYTPSQCGGLSSL